MWFICVNKNKNIIQKFNTKREAQIFLDNRKNLCYMLGVDSKHYYSIVKGHHYASKWLGKKRAMPIT